MVASNLCMQKQNIRKNTDKRINVIFLLMEYQMNNFWRNLLYLRMFKYTQIRQEFLNYGWTLKELKVYSFLKVQVAR